MIVFDVNCSNEHVFEGWFRDSGSFGEQVEAGAVSCPVCGDTKVRKALMAPNVAGIRKGKDDVPARIGENDAPNFEPDAGQNVVPNGGPNAAMDVPDGKLAEFVEALHEFKKHVEDNSDYVGDTFPEEARKIHYGETEARSIYGEATPDEAEELVDEGVDFHRIPWTGKTDA